MDSLLLQVLFNVKLKFKIDILLFLIYVYFKADGSCFSWDLNEANDSIVDFTGPDCDPVYKVVYNQTHVFTCCRDGVIRKYNLNGLF